MGGDSGEEVFGTFFDVDLKLAYKIQFLVE